MLKNILKIKPSQIDLVKKGFSVNSSEPQSQHLQSITNAFAVGFNSVIMCDKSSFNQIELSQKGFYHEGSAMAFALTDCLFLKRPSKFRVIQNIHEWPNFSYLKHVGVGWVFAKVPWARTFLFNKLDPVRRWLAIDGWGFHDAFFKTTKTLGKNFPLSLENEEINVYLQGIGRALWFIKGSEPQLIFKFISQCPSHYRAALWSGVGLAVTYAGCHEKNKFLLDQIKDLSGTYILNLQQGVAFGATAAFKGETVSEQTIHTCNVLTGQTVEHLSKLCDDSEGILPRDGSVKTYLFWQENISKELREVSHNVEKIKA